MPNEPTAFVMLCLFASVNTVLLGAATLTRNKKAERNVQIRFAAFLVCLGTVLGIYAFASSGWTSYSPALRIFDTTLTLLLGPLCLDYVRLRLGKVRLTLWGYAPVAIYVVLSVTMGASIYLRVELLQLAIVLLVYSLVAATDYGLWLKESSDRSRPRVKQVEVLLSALMAISIVQTIYLSGFELSPSLDLAPIIGVCFMLAFFTISLFAPLRTGGFVKPIPGMHQSGQSFQHLSAQIAGNELFLQPDLTLGSLAARLELQPRDVSTAINRGSGGSFNTYINKFRVERAKDLLVSDEEVRTSVEAVGLLCGFKSRSSFYNAFKRETGITPGQYRADSM